MNIMFDLETWGTKPGSILRSIGAVAFEPRGEGIVGEGYYANIDRKSCEEKGLTVDASTEAWWAKQSKEAQDSLLQDQKHIRDVVAGFHQWFSVNRGEQIWCQGANFDSVLWEAVVAACGFRVPWKFWNVRDTRTVYEMCRFNPESVKRPGTYHNALDDAKHQVLCVQAALRNLNGVLA